MTSSTLDLILISVVVILPAARPLDGLSAAPTPRPGERGHHHRWDQAQECPPRAPW